MQTQGQTVRPGQTQSSSSPYGLGAAESSSRGNYLDTNYGSKYNYSTERSLGAQFGQSSFRNTPQEAIKIEENFIKTPDLSTLKGVQSTVRDPYLTAPVGAEVWSQHSSTGGKFLDYHHHLERPGQAHSRVVGPPSAYYDFRGDHEPKPPVSYGLSSGIREATRAETSYLTKPKQTAREEGNNTYLGQGPESGFSSALKKDIELPRGFRVTEPHKLPKNEPNPAALHDTMHSTHGRLGYEGPSFVNYRHELAGLPSENRRLDDYTPYYRMRQDIDRLDKLHKSDFSHNPRFPYTAAYIEALGEPTGIAGSTKRADITPGSSALHSVYYSHYPGTSYYWDLFHRPESYHHRLDPGYLTNFHAFNSHYPYQLGTENYREEAFRPCGKAATGPEYEQWVREVRHKYLGGKYDQPFADKLRTRIGESFEEVDRASKDRFFEAQREQELRLRFPESNLTRGRGQLYITPSRLYDNPDYRDLPRRNIDGALRNVMVPVSADITPADELLYVLTECSRLESDWRDARARAHGPISGRLKKSVELVPTEPYDLAEDLLLEIFEKLGYKPSEKETELFLSRFGQSRRVERTVLLDLLAGERPNVTKKNAESVGESDGVLGGRPLLAGEPPQDAKWLPLLFKSLLKQAQLKERFVSRGVSTEAAFSGLGKERVDEESLRDLLIVRGVFIPATDLSHLCRVVAGGESTTKSDWGLTELTRFLVPQPQ